MLLSTDNQKDRRLGSSVPTDMHCSRRLKIASKAIRSLAEERRKKRGDQVQVRTTGRESISANGFLRGGEVPQGKKRFDPERHFRTGSYTPSDGSDSFQKTD